MLLFPTLFLARGAAQSKDAGSDYFVADPSQAVKLALPERRGHSFFLGIDRNILNYVEIGSPQTLSLAINALRRTSESRTESENVLYLVAVSIMQMCWKFEDFTEPVPEISSKNAYSGAIFSARNGLYDYNTGNTDFFTLALPSLVLAVSDTRSDYYADSEKALSAALQIRPDSVFANYLFGLLCMRLGKYEDAKRYFETVLALNPENRDAAFSLAEACNALFQHTRALEIAERLSREIPQNKDVLKLCAESAFAAGDMDVAETYVGKVLQVEPENSYYLLLRAKILVQKGEYIRAASLLDAYARMDSQSRDYLLLRFTVQKNWNRNISAASATIEKALSLYPDDPQIIVEAALLASETGAEFGGKTGGELADSILEKNPENVVALDIKISSMMQDKKWSEAYAVSSAAIKKNVGISLVPDSLLFNHIKICLNAGKKDEAWSIASEVYSERSSDEEVTKMYIDVLVSVGKKAEAARLIAQLLPSASARMKSFLYYERSFLAQNEDAALADLRSSLTANPRNKDALFRLYTIYFDKKEYRKARYYLKQVVALSPNDESLLVLNQELERILGE